MTTATVVAVGAAVTFGPSIAGVLPPCPVHAATGLDCPGCGMTRAAQALLRGDIVAAIGHNALSMLLVLPLLVVAGSAWLRRRPLPGVVGGRAFAPLFTGVIATFTVLRNIPIEPFDALAA